MKERFFENLNEVAEKAAEVATEFMAMRKAIEETLYNTNYYVKYLEDIQEELDEIMGLYCQGCGRITDETTYSKSKDCQVCPDCAKQQDLFCMPDEDKE